MEEFKHLGVLFISDGKLEHWIPRRIGAASPVTLQRRVVVKKELGQKVKLLSIFAPALTSGHELWVVNQRTRSRIQAAEMRSYLS